MLPTTNSDVELQLYKIEKAVIRILEIVSEKQSLLENKWLTEPQVMQILNVSKRGIAEIRRKHAVRTSSATGRNFLYYKADVENYMFDNSGVRKRRKNDSKNDEDGNKKNL